MDARFLIDNIVRQTTVLVAQLATAVGVRAPLAHVADQVFVQLAREIEAQGVGRKVVADMFGLALRTYQRKVQRITEGQSLRARTLWEAVIEFVSESAVSRARIEERFRYEVADDLAAVLKDLQASGQLECTGKGDTAVFTIASPERQRLFVARHRLEALTNMVWHRIFLQGQATATSLTAEFGVSETEMDEALAWLLREQRIYAVGLQSYRAHNFDLPLGAAHGWETAVFDHFSAMAQAIAHKVSVGRSGLGDVIGGSTFTFTIYPGHPSYARVMGLLERSRAELVQLWQEVAAYNETQPPPATSTLQVRHYFGQDVTALPDESPVDHEQSSAHTAEPSDE